MGCGGSQGLEGRNGDSVREEVEMGSLCGKLDGMGWWKKIIRE